MAKTRSARLAVVAKLAKLREQQQRVRLQQTRAAVAQQREALARLQGFQRDYATGGITVAGQSNAAVSPRALQNFSRFIRDLSQAEQLQQQQLTQAEDILQQNDAHWQQLHTRQQRLEELVEHHRNQEQLQRDSQADQENDDRWNALQQSGQTEQKRS